MTQSDLTLSNPLVRGLACAALSPGLRSILVFDATPLTIRQVADVLVPMLTLTTGSPVSSVTLGTTEAEEALWGHWTLTPEAVFRWQPGLLTAWEGWRLVVMPDLTRLSLAAARACVVLMDAAVAHVERQGQSQQATPKLCWLASCPSDQEQVGMVSPHLLDRFALRLNGKLTDDRDPVKRLLSDLQATPTIAEELLSADIRDGLTRSLQPHPSITAAARDQVLHYFPAATDGTLRRELALLRLALANAQLDGLPEVTDTEVDFAAQMIGLEAMITQPKMPESAKLKIDDTELSQLPAPQPEMPTTSVMEPVYQSDQPEILPATPLFQTPQNPYPEDTASVQREAASLQLPVRRFRVATVKRGVAIGVEPATSLQDLALTSTLLEAAKWQPYRRKIAQPSGQNRATPGLILWQTDLRCYRRAPVAEQMLVLIMDYTSLRDCNWREALLPYLSWAYVERASVCLVQVGAALTQPRKGPEKIVPEELRATKLVERSILVPRLSAGIEAERGRATPLAHGLELAGQTLRHALQHGRSRVQQAVLVVMSDGRGNVPLAASRLGRLTTPVQRQGVDDAVQMATAVRQLDRVQTVLLNPQPRQYPELPLELAQALGAKVVLIPPITAWEEES